MKTLGLFLVLASIPAMPQAALAPVGVQQFFDNTGVPLSGGTVTTYIAGTTTKLATYTDATGTIPASNPIVLDAGGFASIWLGSGSYKFVVKRADGVTVSTTDNISSVGAGLVGLANTWTQPQTIYDLITKNTPMLDVRAFGAKCDNTTDDTAAIQAAITAASSSVIRILFFPGFCKVVIPANGVALQVSAAALRFVGSTVTQGSNAGLAVYGGPGVVIQIGTDDGNSWDSGEYNGFQGTEFNNFTIVYRDTTPANITALNNGQGNYGTGTYGIRDWRGGGVKLYSTTLRGLNYGFWGVQSDINEWHDSFLLNNKVGRYIGPRSDQNSFYDTYALNNDTAEWIDGAKHTRHIFEQYVGNGSATDYPIKIGSVWAGIGGSRGAVFDDCWFEQYDPITNHSFFGIGIGDSLQSQDINLSRPFIVANSTYLADFMSIDNADYISVTRPTFYRSTTAFSGAFFEFVNASSSSNVLLEKFGKDRTFPVFLNSGSGTPAVTITARDVGAGQIVLDTKADTALTESWSFLQNGVQKYQLLFTAGGTFEGWDNLASLSAWRTSHGGSTNLNSQSTNAVTFNADATSGTGGIEVWSGGATPAKVASVSSTGQIEISGGTGGLKLKDQGSCTMAAGTCSAQSLGHTYAAAPVCFAQWTGSGTLTGLIKVPSTTTTFTPASSVGTDTAVMNWACFGS